jgi:arsenate reductase
MNSAERHIVFVCIENSNRSQMAEAFARIHGSANLKAYSSGSRPSGIVNPKAIASMSEKQYDLSKHRSKGLADLPDIQWDAVVTMGCGDACPTLRAKRRIDWEIPDPKHLPPEEFRIVRDTIEGKVKELLLSLKSAGE